MVTQDSNGDELELETLEFIEMCRKEGGGGGGKGPNPFEHSRKQPRLWPSGLLRFPPETGIWEASNWLGLLTSGLSATTSAVSCTSLLSLLILGSGVFWGFDFWPNSITPVT